MKTKSKIFPLWEIILAVLMAAFTVFWSVILPKITPSVISPNRVYALADSTGQFTISVFGNDLADNQFYICSLTTAGGAEVDKDIVLPGSGVGMYGHYDLSEYVERGTIPLFLTVFQHESGGNGLTSQTQLDLDPDAVIVSIYKISVTFPATRTSMCSVEPIYMLQTGIPDIYHKVAWAIFGADTMLALCMICHLIREIVRRRKDCVPPGVNQEDFERQEQSKKEKREMIVKRIFKVALIVAGIVLALIAFAVGVWLMTCLPPFSFHNSIFENIGIALLMLLIIGGGIALVVVGVAISIGAADVKIKPSNDEEEEEDSINPPFAMSKTDMEFVDRGYLMERLSELGNQEQALEEINKLPVYTVEQIYREQESRERFEEAQAQLEEYLEDHEDDLDDDFEYSEDDVWDIASMFAEIQDPDIADNELWNACVRIVVSQIKKRNSTSKPHAPTEEEKEETIRQLKGIIK